MSSPSQGEVTVALSALRKDAQKWSAAAQNILPAQQAAQGANLTGEQFSYFGEQGGLPQIYAQLQQKVAALLGQAAENFENISANLQQVANNYEKNEHTIAESFKSIQG